MRNNKHFQTAKANKNDEFYTKLEDIEEELAHYTNFFNNKIVYCDCDCDNPRYSNFWRYFHQNFSKLKLKKLIATYYSADEQSCKCEYLGGNDDDISIFTKEKLNNNGDFRSDECVEILKECDVVVTNPPFSLWRQLIHLLLLYNKKFLLIGNKTAVIYRELFYKVKENKVWFGYTVPKEFITPDGTTKKVSGICRWYTNIEPRPNIEDVKLVVFDLSKYGRYSSYMAVNVDNIKQIPDTNEIIGVPVTFLDKYNPEQFEILGMSGDREFVESSCDFFIPVTKEQKSIFKKQNNDWRDTHPYFFDEDILTRLFYVRLFVRKEG